MTRVFKPYDAGEERRFLSTHCDLCTASIDRACPIPAAARGNDPFDDRYPSQWVLDDDGAPTCTAFEPRAEAVITTVPEPAAPIEAAAPPPAACDAGLDVASIAVTTIGRGVVDALRIRPGKRAWTVPYASVEELFEDGAGEAMCEGFKVPAPTRARVHHGRQGVTITARTARDGNSVTSTVRLKLAEARA